MKSAFQDLAEGARASAGKILAAALIRPQQLQKQPPCSIGCATGADIRGWVGVLAQHRKMGLSQEEACARAWQLVAEINPFPATLGRICPHPCEDQCNRKDADGGVAINAMERFLGDWALKRRLPLPQTAHKVMPESIGVIGAGPAGLSFAYQMARRGYCITVYEKEQKPGGMLYYGIPAYRLPGNVLEAEIGRIVDLGVELKLGVAVGKQIDAERISTSHDVIFLAIGAGLGLRLGIPGEQGAGAWTGVDYLARLSRDEPVELAKAVVVVGGGNTAVDAARAARRRGARVSMLYRRTATEMPAIAREVEDALAEGVEITYLAAPLEIKRSDGRIHAVTVQRMTLAEADSSGRRRPVPVPGEQYEILADCVIAAVSQEPNWEGLTQLNGGAAWIRAAMDGRLTEGLWAGGDVIGLGIAGTAIAQGRRAAEAVHAKLRNLESHGPDPRPAVIAKGVKADYYPESKPARPQPLPVAERLAQPELEVNRTISEAQFFEEASRCFSCGMCFGCEHCFMYCNAGGFTRLNDARPGAYYALSLECCEACGKCIEICPCGFLSPQ